MAHADGIEKRSGPLTHLRITAATVGEQRHLDVLRGREGGEQVMELEDEAESARAETRSLPFVQRSRRTSLQLDFTSTRPVQQPDQVEERALPGAGRSRQRNELAGAHLQIDAVQDMSEDAFAVCFGHAVNTDERVSHCEWP
jgi:hypothetical protein